MRAGGKATVNRRVRPSPLQGAAMPRSTCSPRGTSGAVVSAATAPEISTDRPSGRHSPSCRRASVWRSDCSSNYLKFLSSTPEGRHYSGVGGVGAKVGIYLCVGLPPSPQLFVLKGWPIPSQRDGTLRGNAPIAIQPDRHLLPNPVERDVFGDGGASMLGQYAETSPATGTPEAPGRRALSRCCASSARSASR